VVSLVIRDCRIQRLKIRNLEESKIGLDIPIVLGNDTHVLNLDILWRLLETSSFLHIQKYTWTCQTM
jgi:hypothetical protein